MQRCRRCNKSRQRSSPASNRSDNALTAHPSSGVNSFQTLGARNHYGAEVITTEYAKGPKYRGPNQCCQSYCRRTYRSTVCASTIPFDVDQAYCRCTMYVIEFVPGHRQRASSFTHADSHDRYIAPKRRTNAEKMTDTGQWDLA